MRLPVDLVVPVKEPGRAKTRMAPAVAELGGSPADRDRARRALALALVGDTLTAVAAADVRRIVVVTAAPAELAPALPAGVSMVTDPQAGLNAALRRGAEYLATTSGGPPGLVAALQGDLPALRPAELDDALDRARAVVGVAGSAFVADHLGVGTTLLVTGPDRRLDPRFGPTSAAAHRAAGAVPLVGAWPGLRTDVDTPADLALAHELGTGPATRAWPGPARLTPARTECAGS